MAKTVKKAKQKVAARPGAAAKRKTTAKKFVYFFGGGRAEGNRHMKDTLGGKGSGLAEMTNAGLPVPPGFTISTAACNLYYELGGKVPSTMSSRVKGGVGSMAGGVATKGNALSNTTFRFAGTLFHLTGLSTCSAVMRMSLPGSSCKRHLPFCVQTRMAPSISRSQVSRGDLM